MRLLHAFVVIGLTTLAPAARAQESICNPCLDVPADYQALKPLATDWPKPSEALNFYRTRFNMGTIGPINMRRLVEPRRSSIEALRFIPPSTVVLPERRVPPATAPASDAGLTGEDSP